MLIPVLSQYLAVHRRLVVPQLGTFIVKEPGRSILFSELLKRDDGVLRGLLCGEGIGELEAAGEIDRFVFEVRHAVEHGGEYRMEGFGRMKPGPNGTIAFVYEPVPAAPSAVESAGPARGKAGMDGTDGKDGKTPAAAGAPVSAAENPAVNPAENLSENPAENAAETPAPGKRPALRPEQLAEAVKTAFAEQKVSPSAKMNPDPSVRGLRYGRPPKTTAAYTYVDRPRRRTDRFIWIAILAAVIAVAAIAFGYYRELRERQAEGEYLEQPVPETAPAAGGRTSAPDGAAPDAAEARNGSENTAENAARGTGSVSESMAQNAPREARDGSENAPRGGRNDAAQAAAIAPAGTLSEASAAPRRTEAKAPQTPAMRKTTDNP